MHYKTVSRFVITMKTPEYGRQLFDPMQGRYTYATAAEAQTRLDAIRENTPRDTLVQVTGSESAADSLQVWPCECYEGHHDPVRRYFE